MKGKRALATGMIVAGLMGYAGTAMATPGSGFTAAQSWKVVFDELDVKTHTHDHKLKIRSKDSSDVHVTRNEIAPGGQSGWHTHPGPSLILVTAGEVTVYDGEDGTCSPTRYRAGEGFVDHGEGQVHLIRNESQAAAETVAVQFLPTGSTRRIDTPAPGTCGF